MKKYRKIIVTTLFVVMLVGLFALYRPLKENQIYQRDLKLVDNSMEEANSTDETKLIKRAKDTLQNLFSITVNEDDYRTNVAYEYSGKNSTYSSVKDVVRISFRDKNTYASIYTIVYDTSTGDLVEFWTQYPDIINENAEMETDQLEKIAKDFFFSQKDIKEEDIQYEGLFQSDLYMANILIKKDYGTVYIYVDTHTGKILFYQSNSNNSDLQSIP